MDAITIKVLNNTYEVNYPNVGQFVDIKVQENLISKGQLSDLILSGLSMADEAEAAITIKIMAFFNICVPDLIKDLKVKSLRDLSMIDFLEIRKIYVKQISPWLNEWQKKIRTIIDEDSNRNE